MAGETAIDFARSSVTWMLPEQPSRGRFALDGALTLPGGETFYLCAQVFAGNVYGSGPLFKEPPYGFSAAFSRARYKIFRDAVRGPALQDSTGRTTEHFASLDMDIRRRACTHWMPLVPPPAGVFSARLRVNAATGVLAGELEFPVRHVNWRDSDAAFQVETGPVLIAVGTELRRAYVAFNRMDEAHFLFDEERAGTTMQSWSRQVRVPCTIRMLLQV